MEKVGSRIERLLGFVSIGEGFVQHKLCPCLDDLDDGGKVAGKVEESVRKGAMNVE